MGTFGVIARGLGQAGSDIGEGAFNLEQLRRQQQQDELARQYQDFQEKMASANLGLREKQIGQSKPIGIVGLPGGGSGIAVWNPQTNTPSVTALTPGMSPQSAANVIRSMQASMPPAYSKTFDPFLAQIAAGQDPLAVLNQAGRAYESVAKPLFSTGAPPKVNSIGNVPYSVTWKDPNTGQEGTWTAENMGDAPPQVQNAWQGAQTAHKQARTEKSQDQARAESLAVQKAYALLGPGGQKLLQQAGAKQLQGQIQQLSDAATRASLMHRILPSAVGGNQQAQLALLYYHLGMTASAQKGARIQRTVIEEAEKSAPWMARIKYHWGPDGYLSGIVLTPDQMKQMVGLADESLTERRQAAKLAVQTAKGLGVPISPQQEQAIERLGSSVDNSDRSHSGMVHMQAPDGSERWVPKANVGKAAKMGAKVIP